MKKLLFFVFLLLSQLAFAQESYFKELTYSFLSFKCEREVVVNKAGRLRNQLQKEQNELKSVAFVGELSSEDISFINTLPNLEELDLTRVTLPDAGGWYSVIDLTGCQNLKKLSVGRSIDVVKFDQKILNTFICETIPEILIENESMDITFFYTAEENDSEVDPKSYTPWSGFNSGLNTDDTKIFIQILAVNSSTSLPISDRTRSRGQARLLKDAIPDIVYFIKEDKAVLNFWEYYMEKNNYLNDVNYFSNYTFSGSRTESITIGKNISIIPIACFAQCKSLKSVEMEAVTTIAPYAFARTAIESITLPETLESLAGSAFFETPISTIIMRGPAPVVYDDEGRPGQLALPNATIIVDPKYEKTYQYGAWKDMQVMTSGANSEFSFTVSKEGTLKDFITQEVAKNARRITIKGIINDLDMVYLHQCKNLSYIDLSECLCLKSEYTAYAEYVQKEQIRGIAIQKLQDLMNDNEIQYAAGWKSSEAYRINQQIHNEAMRELKAAQNVYVKPNKNCYLAEDAFEPFKHLKEVILPKSLVKLISNLYTVEHVSLPPKIEAIYDYCFEGAPLKEITIPETLNYIGPRCFRNCQNLTVVDLSKTKIEKLPFDCFHNSGVEILKLPNTLKEVYQPRNANVAQAGLSSGGASIMVDTIYFYTEEPPKGLSGSAGISTVHVPRGFKNAWYYSSFGENISRYGGTIIDDL